MKNEKNDIKFVVCALLFVSFSLGQGDISLEVSKPNESRRADVDHKKSLVYKSVNHTEANAKKKNDYTNPQLEFLSPYHRVNYVLKSDACKAPNLGLVEDLKSLDTADFFELNITGDGVSNSFISQLKRRLILVFRLYGSLIGSKNLRRVVLNLVVYKQRDEYEDYVGGFAPKSTQTQGLYSHKNISATIHFKNDMQAIRTSIHESVHALSHALIGATPRWLNEGMAEYFELISGSSDLPTVNYNSHWVGRDMQLRYASFDFWQLASMESIWVEGTKREKLTLYANAWHWIYFFMSSDSGIRALKYYLRAEREWPCSIMEASDTYELLNTIFPSFEVDFIQWEQLPLKPKQQFSFQ